MIYNNYCSKYFLAIILIFIIVSCSNKKRANKKIAQLLPEDTVGLIVKIVDGDTYDLLVGNITYRIRMNGIDAPEKGQPYYQKAKDYLGSLCFRKKIKVIKLDIDRYGRAIAESFLNDTINLSYQMVKAGFAWQYKKYSKDQKLAELETMARKNRLGLWADENHTPPWELRDDRRIGRKDSEK